MEKCSYNEDSMDLNQTAISYIETIVKNAKLVNIDSVIIETGFVRALAEDKTVFIFQDQNVPQLPFNSIGLNRLDVFISRLDTAKSCDGFSIKATVDDTGTFVRSLTMKGKNVKIDYRCANPKTIVAPKKFNDILKTQVRLTPEAVMLMQRGQAAMRSDTITLISNEKGVSFELVDINADVFSHTFASSATSLIQQDTNTHFLLLTLFKLNSDGCFNVGQKGILNVEINGLNIFVLPQV